MNTNRFIIFVLVCARKLKEKQVNCSSYSRFQYCSLPVSTHRLDGSFESAQLNDVHFLSTSSYSNVPGIVLRKEDKTKGEEKEEEKILWMMVLIQCIYITPYGKFLSVFSSSQGEDIDEKPA